MPEIEFGSRQAALEIRNDPLLSQFVAEDDDLRSKTVVVEDDAPDRALTDITGEAADSMKAEAEKFGQASLTEREREQIDFTKTTVPEARSAKAIAQGKGVDDFTAFFDEEATVDEHREIFERAKKDERGSRGGGMGRDSEAQRAARLADAFNQTKEEERGRAVDAALRGDSGARDFLGERTEGDLGAGDFDIGFSRTDNGIVGKGADFERVMDVHEERSERAQRMDERRSADVTRDPLEWSDNPAGTDFPGVDTVDPEELHLDRSQEARRADEREKAPIADTREEWAMDMDHLDWPGVDTPEDF